jgi:D-arabinose 5-phosphate isomerase GutQ
MKLSRLTLGEIDDLCIAISAAGNTRYLKDFVHSLNAKKEKEMEVTCQN